MDASTITKLMALLEQFPDLKTKLMSMVNMDEAVALVKSKGLEIAKSELQEFIAKKLMSGSAKDMLGNLAAGAAKEALGKAASKGGAADLLKGILG